MPRGTVAEATERDDPEREHLKVFLVATVFILLVVVGTLGTVVVRMNHVVAKLNHYVETSDRRSVAVDQAFCHVINDNRSVNNGQNHSMRDVINRSFQRPGGSEELLAALSKARNELLALLPEDRALVSCSGVGDVLSGFAEQPALNGGAVVPNTTTTSTTPGHQPPATTGSAD